jgi:hypothetical protein
MKNLILFILFTALLLGIVITWASYLYRQPPVNQACQDQARSLVYPAIKYATIAWDYRLTTDGGVLAWPRTLFNFPLAYISYPSVYDCEVGENGAISYPFIK